MSCYEWERGTITLPAKEWAAFRKGLLEAWNALELERLSKAVALHARLKEAIKGKRGTTKAAALREAGDRLCPEHREENEGVRGLLFSYDWATRTLSLKPLPKKKDLKLLPLSKDAVLDLGDASISLSNDRRTVTWSVGENNHAREHARRHPMARELFRRLDRVTWTRGSGGKLVGNDEYNRDTDDEDGGSNYVTAEYGPNVRRPGASRAFSGSSFSGSRGWR